jgi:hypothetical protein
MRSCFGAGKSICRWSAAIAFRLVPVALGLDDGREVEITNGIRPDDLIALNLGQSVRDGAPVQPVETASR